MKKIVLIIILCSISVYTVNAQKTIRDFTYVIVPEVFDFVGGNDPFELSSMTKFYLNKNGFNAYFNSEAPNTNRCEGLFANVQKEKSVLKTKLYIAISDCNGNELYRTDVGVSKYKDWKTSYQDALRKTAKSLEEIDMDTTIVETQSSKIDKGEVIAVTVKKTETEKKDDIKEVKTKVTVAEIPEQGAPVKKAVVTTSETVASNTNVQQGSTEKTLNTPKQKFSNYARDGVSYLLRKTQSGYSFYKETSASDDGLELIGEVTISNGAMVLMQNGTSHDVLFDASMNMTIFSGTSPKRYLFQN